MPAVVEEIPTMHIHTSLTSELNYGMIILILPCPITMELKQLAVVIVQRQYTEPTIKCITPKVLVLAYNGFLTKILLVFWYMLIHGKVILVEFLMIQLLVSMASIMLYLLLGMELILVQVKTIGLLKTLGLLLGEKLVI